MVSKMDPLNGAWRSGTPSEFCYLKKLSPGQEWCFVNPGTKHATKKTSVKEHVQESNFHILGMVIQPLIGNPYNGYT